MTKRKRPANVTIVYTWEDVAKNTKLVRGTDDHWVWTGSRDQHGNPICAEPTARGRLRLMTPQKFLSMRAPPVYPGSPHYQGCDYEYAREPFTSCAIRDCCTIDHIRLRGTKPTARIDPSMWENPDFPEEPLPKVPRMSSTPKRSSPDIDDTWTIVPDYGPRTPELQHLIDRWSKK